MSRRLTPSVVTNVLSVAVRGLGRTVQGCAFWTAALLPMGYVPLLVVAPSQLTTPSILGKLAALNVVALLVGHGYATDDGGDEAS